MTFFIPIRVLADNFGRRFSSTWVIQGLRYLLSCGSVIPSDFRILCRQPGEEAKQVEEVFFSKLLWLLLPSVYWWGLVTICMKGGGDWEVRFLAGNYLPVKTGYCGMREHTFEFFESFWINPKIYLGLLYESESKLPW